MTSQSETYLKVGQWIEREYKKLLRRTRQRGWTPWRRRRANELHLRFRQWKRELSDVKKRLK